jgi:hypothetical protein
MDLFIRGLIMSRALLCAASAAVISMPVIGFLDPQIRNALVSVLLGGLTTAMGDPHSPAQASAFLKQAFLTAPFSICVVPVICAGLTGELIKARSWIWYACCSGVLAAATPLDPGVWRGAVDAARSRAAAGAAAEIVHCALCRARRRASSARDSPTVRADPSRSGFVAARESSSARI